MSYRRLTSPCDVYHVTSRGVGGQVIFEDDFDRKHFLRLLKESCDRYHVKVAAWCLMDNHFHLLLNAPIEFISKSMQYLKKRYARDANEKYGREGHLFQGAFSSFPIADESYFVAAINYIHDNPVRAGIVSHSSGYRWSSYQEYLGKHYLLEPNLMIDLRTAVLGDDRCESLVSLKRSDMYVGASLSDELAMQRAKEHLGIETLTVVKGYQKDQRDKTIRQLADIGLKQSQISRMTGVSSSTVSRALV